MDTFHVSAAMSFWESQILISKACLSNFGKPKFFQGIPLFLKAQVGIPFQQRNSQKNARQPPQGFAGIGWCLVPWAGGVFLWETVMKGRRGAVG